METLGYSLGGNDVRMKRFRVMLIVLPALIALAGGVFFLREAADTGPTGRAQAMFRTPTKKEAREFHHVLGVGEQARMVPGSGGTEWEVKRVSGTISRLHGHNKDGSLHRFQDHIYQPQQRVNVGRKLIADDTVPDDAPPHDWEVSNWTKGDAELAGATGEYVCASSGPRMQLVYMYPDIWDRRDKFKAESEKIVKAFSAHASLSSWQHGGPPKAKIRVICSGGKPQVRNVIIKRVPGGTHRCGFLWLDTCDDPLAEWPSEELLVGPDKAERILQDVGIWEDNVRYLVVWDGEGVASAFLDHGDEKNPDLSEPGVSVTAVDWPRARSVLHEYFHTMGAVQTSAPNSLPAVGSAAGHCRDGQDLLCYGETVFGADGTTVVGGYNPGICAPASPQLLDCGGDDYFNPFPRPDSYLANHRNTATIGFFEYEGDNRCGEWTRSSTSESGWSSGCGIENISPTDAILDEDRGGTSGMGSKDGSPTLAPLPAG